MVDMFNMQYGKVINTKYKSFPKREIKHVVLKGVVRDSSPLHFLSNSVSITSIFPFY